MIWVGGDSIYGNSLVVRQHLYDKSKHSYWMSDKKWVFISTSSSLISRPKSGTRMDTHCLCLRQQTALRAFYSNKILDDKWQTITHRQGNERPLNQKLVILDVYIWKPERQTAIEAVQLLISSETDGSEIKYSLCYTPEGNCPDTALFATSAIGAKELFKMLKK